MADYYYIVQAVTMIYDPITDNDTRTSTIEALQQYVITVSSPDLAKAGLDIILDENQSLPVRAYGGVLVNRGVRDGRVAPADVPYEEILQFLETQGGSIDRLIVNSLSDLLVSVALYMWPEKWDSFLPVCCPEGKLHQQPALQRTLLHFTLLCDDPPFQSVGRDRISALRKGIRNAAPAIVSNVVLALHEQYSLGEELAPAVEMGVCLEIIETVSRHLNVERFWEMDIDHVFQTLVTFRPSSHKALLAAASIINNTIKFDGTDEANPFKERAAAFAASVLGQIDYCVAEELWDVVQAMLDLGVALVQGGLKDSAILDEQLVALCASVLKIPSVAFCANACDILLVVGERSIQLIDVPSVMLAFQALIPKHRAHPDQNSDAPVVMFSQNQFPTSESFDVGFSEMRTKVGQFLRKCGEGLPGVSFEMITHLVQNNLPDPVANPSTVEDRTPFGHCTQRTTCFTEWEATAFTIGHLEGVFAGDTLPDDGAMRELFENYFRILNVTTDAVLAPIALNILSAFAKYPGTHWHTVLDTTFTFMNMAPTKAGSRIMDDIDLVSARKRAFTLLISFCTDYPHRLFDFRDLINSQAQNMLMNQESMLAPNGEAGLLFESLASLSNGMTSDVQAQFLGEILGQRRASVHEKCMSLSAENVAFWLQGSEDRKVRRARSEFLDELIVLVSMLKRCNSSPYLQDMASEMIPAFGRLLCELEQLGQFINPDLAAVIFRGYDHVALKQVKGGGGGRSSYIDANKSAHERTAGYLFKLRQTLHQAMGSVSKFLNPSDFAEGFNQLIAAIPNMKLDALRSLCEHCLFPVGNDCPEIILSLFPALEGYLINAYEYMKSGRMTKEDEIALPKLNHYFSKDVVNFINKTVVTPKVHLESADAAAALISILRAIFITGFWTRGVLDVIGPLIHEQLANGGESGMQWALGFYAMMAVETVSNSIFNEHDRRSLNYFLADLYKKEYPKFGNALLMAGCPQDDVDKLNYTLTTIPKIDGQRRKFGEILPQILNEQTANVGLDCWMLK